VSGSEDVPPIVWDCAVEEGKVTTFDLLLGSIRPVDIVVTLRIDGAIAKGFGGLLATSAGKGGGWTSDKEATIDGDGRFHMRAVRPGRYLVILLSEGDRGRRPAMEVAVTLDAVPGDNPVDVDLSTGRIEGTAANPNDRSEEVELRREIGNVRVTQRAAVASDGSFVFAAAPSGACTVERSGKPPKTVEVAARQTSRVELP
jgi:hypothetical protein